MTKKAAASPPSRAARFSVESVAQSEGEEEPLGGPTARAMAAGGSSFNPDAMSPVECKVKDHGNGQAVVHHVSHLTIEAFDGRGKQMQEGGETFFASIRGPARVRGRVTYQGDGTYVCSWTPPQSGVYSIVISAFGVALPGCPYIVEAASMQPFATKCVVSGQGLTNATARATQTFDVEYKDRLGNVTQAVDLDVFLEQMPIGSPREHAREPQRDMQSFNQGYSSPGYDSAEEESGEKEFTRQRNVRYKVKPGAPLVIRATVELDSPQIGTILPGQMFTVIMEKGGQGRVRAMIALESVSWAAEGIGVGAEAAALSPRLLLMPPPPEPEVEAETDTEQPASPLRADATPERAARSETPTTVRSTGEGASADVDAETGDEGEEDEELSSRQEPEMVASEATGWVTTIKHGKRFVTSKVRQSTGSRQAHAEQWVRRAATDRALSKSKAEAQQRNADVGEKTKSSAGAAGMIVPKISLELDADPSGIGFAFGGVYPGVLHAKGKSIETHKVSYSIGRVGTYLLHVRLRQQAVALPGSPFRLEVQPNEAHALSTKLPPGSIVGFVGSDNEAGCGVTIHTYDLMGNACIAGGAVISGNPVDKAALEKRIVAATVKDNEDGSYYLHWKSSVCGTYLIAIKIANEHVNGSPTTVKFTSIAPQHSKTEVHGDGLTVGTAGTPSSFRVKFFDEFDNRATPGPNHKLGVALLQGKTYKDVQGTGLEYTMVPVDEDKCEHELTYTPSVEGTFSLHVWADISDANGRHERQPLPGSPFQCVVVPGSASPDASFVEGWTKESRAVDKHGKAVDRPDLIIAGDAVICRPVICDALGNKTAPEEGTLEIELVLPDGTVLTPDGNHLKLIEGTKAGFTTYDIRHDATRSGDHEVHIKLNGKQIKGSPIPFTVTAAVPEVKGAKLLAPTENPLFSNTAYTILLETYDRFGNAIPHGGLAVAARLNIVKNSAHDLTTLVPNNHTVDVVDNEDGTYNVSVSLVNLAATVKAVVNMDKNLPANGGELPAIQLTFELPPGDATPARAPTPQEE